MGVRTQARDVLNGRLELRHLLQIVGPDDVLFLFACACDLPSIEAVLIEIVLESCIGGEHVLHSPSPRGNYEVGHICDSTVALQLLLGSAEVDPGHHGST